MIRTNCFNCGKFVWLTDEQYAYELAAQNEYEAWEVSCQKCQAHPTPHAVDPAAALPDENDPRFQALVEAAGR